MIGIYKITSPTGRVYIGQSLNIKKRISRYKKSDCKGQTRLYRSLKKYGWEKHTFDVIEECSLELLNERERYWQDHYMVTSDKGMNLMLTKTHDRSGHFSSYSRKKMSESAKKRVLTPEEIKKRTQWLVNSNIKRRGISKTKEQREKISKTLTGRKRHFFRDFNHPNSVTVLDTETGIFYGSIADCARAFNKNRHWLCTKIRERNRMVNNTKFIIV